MGGLRQEYGEFKTILDCIVKLFLNKQMVSKMALEQSRKILLESSQNPLIYVLDMAVFEMQ